MICFSRESSRVFGDRLATDPSTGYRDLDFGGQAKSAQTRRSLRNPKNKHQIATSANKFGPIEPTQQSAFVGFLLSGHFHLSMSPYGKTCDVEYFWKYYSDRHPQISKFRFDIKVFCCKYITMGGEIAQLRGNRGNLSNAQKIRPTPGIRNSPYLCFRLWGKISSTISRNILSDPSIYF